MSKSPVGSGRCDATGDDNIAPRESTMPGANAASRNVRAPIRTFFTPISRLSPDDGADAVDLFFEIVEVHGQTHAASSHGGHDVGRSETFHHRVSVFDRDRDDGRAVALRERAKTRTACGQRIVEPA